jgi:predicted PurR-regulated permease PerM
MHGSMSDDSTQQVVPPRSLARSIALGGIGIVLFSAGLTLAWYASSVIFLLFAGVLFSIVLNALTDLLGKAIGGPHALRLVIVGVCLAAFIVTIIDLGGTTIAQQASVLSGTIKSQIDVLKTFLDQHGVDTSLFDLGNASSTAPRAANAANSSASSSGSIQSAGSLAGSAGAILGPSIAILLSVFQGFAHVFIVMFLGVLLAAQPKVYKEGLLSFVPQRHLACARAFIDDLGETLHRWLLGQLITMTTIFTVMWIGLSLIGIPGALVLGAQAGFLTFIPTVGLVISGFIVVLASLGSGWTATAIALGLCVGVQFFEGNILTPLIQRQAIHIAPAVLFATQVTLGTLFGLWGLALALPVIAIVKVTLRHFYRRDAAVAA